MKLTPKQQYKLAFWSITAPALIPFVVLIILAVINPLWFRQDMISWVERFARTVGVWRDERTYVKYFYNKHTLFDQLKS